MVQKKSAWLVYIIETKSGKYYTGITTDLQKRFAAHKEGGKGARFFRFSGAQKIVYQEPQPNRSKATKREIKIKKMSRAQKLKLIEGIL
jgi:putative endonuclease